MNVHSIENCRKVSPRTASQNQEIQAVSRAKIVESALTLFAQHGYESTTIKQIAEHAGISQGLMYHYFVGKEDLLRMVFRRCVEPLRQMMEALDETPAPQQKLEWLIRQVFEIAKNDQTAARLFYALRSQMAFLNILRGETLELVNALRDIFEDCFRGLGREQPAVEAALLYALLEGMLRHYLLEPEWFPLDAAVERVIALFCARESVK